MKTRQRQLCSLVGGEAQVGRREVTTGGAGRLPQRQTDRQTDRSRTHEQACVRQANIVTNSCSTNVFYVIRSADHGQTMEMPVPGVETDGCLLV